MAAFKNKINEIDFNCDLAQSFGVYRNETEYELLDFVSSVNISCGFHAGDANAIKKAFLACKEKNVSIGAHIGFPDISGFGYHQMELSSDEIESIVIYQIGALTSFAKSFNLEIEHVRPHGAMYKKAAEDYQFSLHIANAIKKFDKWLIYYGAAGQTLQNVSEEADIRVAHEVFLDKKYNIDNTINFNAEDIINTDYSINRLNSLLKFSEIDNIEQGRQKLEFCDTIHFANKAINAIDLISKAKNIITPTPVNYNKVKSSGWLE